MKIERKSSNGFHLLKVDKPTANRFWSGIPTVLLIAITIGWFAMFGNTANAQTKDFSKKSLGSSSQIDIENTLFPADSVQPAPGTTSSQGPDFHPMIVAAESDLQHDTVSAAAEVWGIELTSRNLIAFLGLSVATGLISYSLVTTGKNGWGWFSILVGIGVVAFFGRVSIAIFREMAGGQCPTDWDED